MKDSFIHLLTVVCISAVAAFDAKAQPCVLDWDVSIGNPGFDGEVLSLAVHDDGTGPALYAGGRFTTAGGELAARVAKWDGHSWSPLGEGIGGAQAAFDVEVRAMQNFDDGNGPGLFVAGDFTRAGNVADARGIAVWRDGVWSAVGSGVVDSSRGEGVRSMVVFDDGTGPALFVGGIFGFDAEPSNMISLAKWDGAEWSGLGDWRGGRIDSLVAFDDGGGPALLVAGEIADPAPGGLLPVPIAKWTGDAWVKLAGGTPRGDWYNYQPCPIGRICPLLEPPDGDLMAVFDAGRGASLFLTGFFRVSRDFDFDSPVQWTGRRWSDLRGGAITGRVSALATHDDGNDPALYAGGSFTAAGDTEANRIAQWNGRQWSTLGAGVGSSHVAALLSFDDGTGPALYVGGDFESAGGLPTQNIARWTCGEKLLRRGRTP